MGSVQCKAGDIKFDAETVIADFLGDMADNHPSVGSLPPKPSYAELRGLAMLLIDRLKENDLGIVTV